MAAAAEPGAAGTGDAGSSDAEDQQDKQDIRDILRLEVALMVDHQYLSEALKALRWQHNAFSTVLELLRTKRDMTLMEAKLTVAIEDPREVERRKQLGIEADRGCSRETLAAALVEVSEGKVPNDRVVLRELAKDMLAWPNLEDEIAEDEKIKAAAASPYAKATPTGVDPKLAARRAGLEWDAAAESEGSGAEVKDLSQFLPKWVGYSFLYSLSGLPIVIGITVVVILFLNSLQ